LQKLENDLGYDPKAAPWIAMGQLKKAKMWGNEVDGQVLIRVEGINKTFTSTKAVVNVDLDVKAGEIRGLIGENGSGKSTLASMIAGVYKPDSGKMWFCGESYSPRSLL